MLPKQRKLTTILHVCSHRLKCPRKEERPRCSSGIESTLNRPSELEVVEIDVKRAHYSYGARSICRLSVWCDGAQGVDGDVGAAGTVGAFGSDIAFSPVKVCQGARTWARHGLNVGSSQS